MSLPVEKFIHQIDKFALDMHSPSYFDDLLSVEMGNGEELFSIVHEFPDILMEFIPNTDMAVFDYFYEKMIKDASTAVVRHQWLKNMAVILTKVNSNIKSNSFYILNLQKTHICHNEMFILLVKNDFDIGNPESLIYSLIARGELTKVKCISDFYVIEDLQCIFDVALKYGRHNIISYLLDDLELKLELESFNKILDFENLDPLNSISEPYLYWNGVSQNTQLPENCKQDYSKCLELLFSSYTYPITVNTLNKWCELIKSNLTKTWDKVETAEVLVKLKSRVSESLSKHDFGIFNHIIHPDTDENLIEQLKQQLYELQRKYDTLLEMYRRVTG